MLPLSLGWKLAVTAATDEHRQQNIIAFLTGQGFDAAENEDTALPGIQAIGGDCRMRVIRHDSANRDIIRNHMAATDRLFFIRRGKINMEQPNALNVLDELWTSALRKIGLADRQPPVLSVVASAQCDVDRLPWEQLQ
jgi:hypothetical protein